jgi:hypothetical protein
LSLHTGNWWPNSLNNNETTPELKSKKVDWQDKAVFRISLWKNNAGSPGELIGEFDHELVFDLINRDYLELIVIKVNGKYYLQAISTKLLGKIIVQILLS